MTYYLTKTSPLVFTTQKAERVEEWMIQDMLELLLKREYEVYEAKEAYSNLMYWIQMDSLFQDVPALREEPTSKDVQWWVEQTMWFSELGQKLRSQVGAPLHKQTEDEEYLSDETTLSDLMEGWSNPSEWDSEGPELHSQFSNPSKSEA
jgi:hypothetical protein